MRALAGLVFALAVACHAQPTRARGPATCAQVADHVLALLPDHGDHGRKVRDVIEAHCRVDRWGSDVTQCMVEEPELHANHHCQDHLAADQRIAFTRDLAAIDAPPLPAAPERSWPRECEEYGAAIGELFACPAYPTQERDAIKAAFEQALAQWENLPPDALPSVAESCRAATDAIHQSLAQVCPP